MMRARLQKNAELFGGIGLALWGVALVLFLVGVLSPERVAGIFLFGVVFLALYVYARPTPFEAALTGRAIRYGAHATITALALIGIVALVNVLSARYHWRQDLTENQSYALSPRTIQVLQELKSPVQAVAFFPTIQGGAGRTQAEDRLKEYARHSDKFTYKFIDPDENPIIARDYKAFPNMIVFERGTRRENTFSTDEQSVVNAILKVAQETQPTLYFTTGHGEHSVNDNSEDGYARIRAVIENSYKTNTLDLRTITQTLPSDIGALVIAGPTKKFEPAEVEVVRNYLSQNGRVLILLDPQADAGLEILLREWGLEARNDLVIDPLQGLQGRAQYPVVFEYKPHPITNALSGLALVLPGARSLGAVGAPAGKSATPLFASSDQSWGETDFAALRNQIINFDVNRDARGPLEMGYAVEASGGDKPPRVVVIGNSTFIANQVSSVLNIGAGSGNESLFFNALNWLTGQETLLTIPPKPSDRRQIFLSGVQTNFVFWSSVAFLPLAVMLLGVIVWWRRR